MLSRVCICSLVKESCHVFQVSAQEKTMARVRAFRRFEAQHCLSLSQPSARRLTLSSQAAQPPSYLRTQRAESSQLAVPLSPISSAQTSARLLSLQAYFATDSVLWIATFLSSHQPIFSHVCLLFQATCAHSAKIKITNNCHISILIVILTLPSIIFCQILALTFLQALC